MSKAFIWGVFQRMVSPTTPRLNKTSRDSDALKAYVTAIDMQECQRSYCRDLPQSVPGVNKPASRGILR